MRKKTAKNNVRMLLKELLSLLLFAAVVFGGYKGAGYLRGIQLNRVYGKTATVLEKQMMERKDWKYAASTEEDDPTAKPDDVEPYLVILVGRFSTKDPHFWDVLAWSGKDKTSLEGVNTVIFCQYTTKTASYGPAGSKTGATSGTSEYVTIRYVNADTGECYRLEKIGKDLPGSVSDVPHYKVSYNKLLSHIKKTLEETES